MTGGGGGGGDLIGGPWVNLAGILGGVRRRPGGGRGLNEAGGGEVGVIEAEVVRVDEEVVYVAVTAWERAGEDGEVGSWSIR